MAMNMTIEQVKILLKNADLFIVEEKRTGNNLGTTLKLANNVEETKLSLAKEMKNNGYSLDIAKL